LIRKYGKHGISTDDGTWYPQARRFLNVEYHIHSSIEKSFIERSIQYIKMELKVLLKITLLALELIECW
jgi:putative transposase